MLIRFSTLMQWLPLLTHSAEEVADLLTRRSFEVEDVHIIGPDWTHMVVGHVVEISEHPNADKLRIASVDVGGDQPRRIICGASNLAVDQYVPVALPGAQLPDGTKITESVIRGESSEGMICSEEELGLAETSTGIMVLETEELPGTPLSYVIEEGDFELEIDTTALGPRASDAFSAYGVAREIATLTGTPLQEPELSFPEETNEMSISRDETICKRYLALEAEGVANLMVTPRKDINTTHTHPLVALGNYVMEEVGQPIHVFDADKLSGTQITVRQAEEGEHFIGLGGEELVLKAGDIVICDEEKIIALAGILGSENSKVDDETDRIVVESACFEPRHILRTARRLHQLTDASKRFEKGLPVEFAETGLGRFIYYLEQMAQLVIEEGDASGKEEYSWHVKEQKLFINGYIDDGERVTDHEAISLSPAYVASYLGVDIAPENIRGYLEQIGCQVEEHTSPREFLRQGVGLSFLGLDTGARIQEYLLDVTPPWYRLDLKTPEDLIEEVARLYGYEHITPDTTFAATMAERNSFFEFCKGVRYTLKGLGYDELHTYPYASEGEIRLQNPVSEETPFMRGSLREGMRRAVEKNTGRGHMLQMFEIAQVFYTTGEQTHLTVYMELSKGTEEARHLQCLRAGIIRVLQDRYIDVEPLTLSQPESGLITWWYDGTEVGTYRVEDHIVELNLSRLYEVAKFRPWQFKSLSVYPSVKRDITLSVATTVSSEELYQLLKKYRSDLCERITFVDVYEADTYKNVTFHLEYRASDRSLTDKEVSDYIEYLIARVQSHVDTDWV